MVKAHSTVTERQTSLEYARLKPKRYRLLLLLSVLPGIVCLFLWAVSCLVRLTVSGQTVGVWYGDGGVAIFLGTQTLPSGWRLQWSPMLPGIEFPKAIKVVPGETILTVPLWILSGLLAIPAIIGLFHLKRRSRAVGP